MKYIAMMMVSVFMITGCSLKKEVLVLPDIKYYKPNPILTTPTEIPTPPTQTSYMNMSLSERERALTVYNLHLMKQIAKGNNKLRIIRNIYEPSVK